jgi:hypothetical protein
MIKVYIIYIILNSFIIIYEFISFDGSWCMWSPSNLMWAMICIHFIVYGSSPLYLGYILLLKAVLCLRCVDSHIIFIVCAKFLVQNHVLRGLCNFRLDRANKRVSRLPYTSRPLFRCRSIPGRLVKRLEDQMKESLFKDDWDLCYSEL